MSGIDLYRKTAGGERERPAAGTLLRIQICDHRRAISTAISGRGGQGTISGEHETCDAQRKREVTIKHETARK